MNLNIEKRIETLKNINKEMKESILAATETAKTLESFFTMLHVLKSKIEHEAGKYDDLIEIISDFPHYENELGRAEFAQELLNVLNSYRTNEKNKQK